MEMKIVVLLLIVKMKMEMMLREGDLERWFLP